MSPKNPHLTQMSHARPPPNYSNHREKNIKLSLLFMQKKICKMVEWFSFKILVHVHVHIQVLVFRWKAKLDGTHADWVLLISILHLTLHQKGNVKAALIWVISHQFKLHNLWETFRRNYFYLFTYNSRAESSINWFFKINSPW